MLKTTCFDIWRQEIETPRIVTLCKELDDKLGGGIAAGFITEFCGGPGCGKTQMCFQLCINVQFPKCIGGLQSKAIYLDTNQDFSPTRILELAVSTEKRFQRLLGKNSFDPSSKCDFTANSILAGINYIYCENYLMLQTAVENIPEMVRKDKDIKLIVIDSFSFPIRVIEEVAERTGITYNLLTILQHLTMEYKIVVVITNELTTRFNDNEWKICPALGDSHAHKINHRIIVSKCNEQKYYMALVEKSNMMPQVAIPFVIKHNGIRGIS
ncbi:unnamed protein product [Ceratitis capitata]|uniref:DNA repair protein RAD51 homolog 3 n=1 Tax=Ceratitis capitata TaxID=7213 RepID=A0A811UF91_CERCA|nr:unnamed protein product [Ceratitis capitata]